MRLWIRAGGPAPDSGKKAKTGIHLTRELLEGDEQIGSLDKALNDHAQRLYDELRDLPIGQSGKPPQEIAKVAFKGLTGAGRKSQDTRRYATVEELSLIAGASVNETIAVLNRFRSAGNQFLRPIDGDLSKDSKVNIVHEAVIRKWSLLTQWVREEARDAEQNRRLSVSARDHAIGEAGLYRETDLKWADERWKWKEPQFRAWARRYQISGEEGDRQAELNRLFEIEMDRNFQFLTDSEAAVKLDQQQERLRIQSEAYAKAAQRSEELERDIQAEQEKAAELEAKLKSEQVSASQMEEGLKLERQRANEFSRKTRNRTRLAFAFGFAVLLMGVGLGIVNHNDGEFALNQRLEIDAQRRKLTAQEQEAAEKLSAADQKTAAALKTLGSTRTADGLLEAKMQRRLDLAQAEEADVKRRLQAEIDLWDRNRTTIATLGHDKFVALSTVSKHLNTIKQLKDASSTTLSYVDGLETQLEQDDIAFNDDKKKLDDAGSNNKVLLGKVGDLQKLLDDAVKTGQKLGDTAVALGHEKDYLSVMLQRFCEAYSATIAKSESKLSPSAHYDLAVSGPKDLIAPTVHYDSNSKSVVASNDEGLGPFQQFDDVTLTDRILSRTYPLAKGYGIRAVAYHPKDQFVGYGLTAGANQPHPQHYVVIYRLPLLPTGSGKTIPSSQSALPPNGSTSVNGGRAVTPNLVDDPTISFLVDSPCVKLVFAKDCSAVIVLTQSGLVSVWHWESGYPLQEKYVRPIGRTSPILSVGFKDDKARSAFVISADGKPEIWKLPVWRPSPPSKPSWKQLKDDLRNLG
jgi:hypothetical protein